MEKGPVRLVAQTVSDQFWKALLGVRSVGLGWMVERPWTVRVDMV
jgi:hypothetical protein